MTPQDINNQFMLRVGTILHGTYRIDSYLSSGGFGNTYVATNVEFDERVAIKEFFMKGVTQRDDNQTTVSVSNLENNDSFLGQKEKFKKEARRIRQLKNDHIVNVHDLFEENGTAYYVMDFVDGENLSERLKHTGEPMSENEVRDILPQILDALKSVHDAGIWHLDLKPANIMLTKEGKVKLIDFGASKQLDAQKGGATTSTAISYTNGYAPREQLEQNYDKFGPWTDIYALGATLYNLLTNKRPPLPTDIDDDMSEDKHNALPFPESVGGMKFLVLQMMKTNRLLRLQSVDAIISTEKSIKEEPKQTPMSSKTTQTFSTYDKEATIIAESKSKERGKMVEPIFNPNVNKKGNIEDYVEIDYISQPIPFVWISIISVLALLMIVIYLVPLFVEIFGIYRAATHDYVLGGLIVDSQWYILEYICLLFINILKTILLFSLLKGFNKRKYPLLLIRALLIMSIIMVFRNFSHDVFRTSYHMLMYLLYYLLSVSLGAIIIYSYFGKVTKLGYIYMIYGIYGLLFCIGNIVESPLIICGELVWIIGMWWMLTRRPINIKEK